MKKKIKFVAIIVVCLICPLCFSLNIGVQERTDTTSYKLHIIEYDKWYQKTIKFPQSSDIIRIIIDEDTLFTNENYLRVLIKHELKKNLK